MLKVISPLSVEEVETAFENFMELDIILEDGSSYKFMPITELLPSQNAGDLTCSGEAYPVIKGKRKNEEHYAEIYFSDIDTSEPFVELNVT